MAEENNVEAGQTANDFLHKLAEDLEKNPPEDKNKGHEALQNRNARVKNLS